MCVLPNAAGSCVDGECRFVECRPNWHDLDGSTRNGCEYGCVVRSPDGAPEACNGADDDCDGEVDEAHELEPAPLADRQVGVCSRSVKRCSPAELGWVEPRYGTLPGYEEVEVTCDGRDNDCDGRSDESHAVPCASCAQPDQGIPCNGCVDVIVPGGWVCLPPGDGVIGVEVREGSTNSRDVSPPQSVRFTRPMLMMEREVTLADWVAVTGLEPPTSQHPRCEPLDHPFCPLHWVSRDEAAWFANAWSLRDGLEPCYDPDDIRRHCEGEVGIMPANLGHQGFTNGDYGCDISMRIVLGCTGYRLPTEAEWEYAARAGTRTDWFFGPDPEMLDRYAHCDVRGGQLIPAGQFDPNPWGLHDMYGNVAEFVADRFHFREPPLDVVVDPVGSYLDNMAPRGGRVQHGPDFCSSWMPAGSVTRTHKYPYFGFRLVRAAVPSEPREP